ncbi:pyocin knob domain-containing protein [Flavobacterium beibuense]|uniref:pyocin knob domain-containing protein n=1 Tax=Flavobacterium beibuense TaxID=657326 RepID=UPI003A8F2EB8
MSDLINIEVTSGGSGQNINVEVNQSNQELILGAVAQVQQILQQMQDLINNNPVVNQNNILSWRKYGEVISGSGDISAAHVASWLNVQPYTFSVSQLQTPVVFEFTRVVNDINKKYIFFFKKGAGVWGKAGGAVQDPNKWFYASQFESLPPIPVTIDDLQQDPNAEIINIDPVVNGDYISKANQSIWDFTASGQPGVDGNPIAFYLSYTYDNGSGDKLYFVKFVGPAGNYGSGLTPLTENHFVSSTNDGVISVPTLQEITNQGNSTDNPIAIYDTGGTGDKTLFSGNGISHYDNIGNETKIKHKPKIGDMVVFFPAKEGEQVLAMQSDLSGLTLESNQAAAELYLKNAEGEILSTINVAFLNNEGTTFFYNESTEKLELKNDTGDVLSEVPVGAFVANLMQSVNFNGASPFILEFKDAEGTVVDSVSFSISNIQGLQSALNDKISTSHPANNITSINLTNWQKAFTDYVSRRQSSPVEVESFSGDLNTINKGTYMTSMSTTATNKPFSDVGGLISVGSATLGFQILGARTGDELWFRPYTGTYGSWYRLWSSEDFNVDSSIGDAQDLNNYTKTGNYSQTLNSQAASGSNYPEPVSGMLEVYSNNVTSGGGVRVYQKYHTYTNTVYIRTNNAGTWFPWVKVWDNGDFTQTDIDSWNIVKVSADYTNPTSSVGYGGGNSINDLPKGTYTAILSTNITDQPFTSVGGFISIGATGVGQGTQILGSRTGNELWFRPYSNTYGSWYRLWNSGDFSQADVTNWNEAFNRGDFRDYGLGVSNTLLYPQSDLNNITVPNGFYTVPNNILNIPTNAGGALTLERYAGYITQKYQAVNAGDVVRLFIRHYKTAAASWTPWREIWTDENLTTDNIAQWDEAYTHSDSSGNPHNTQISDIQNLQDELNNLQSQLDSLATGGKKVYKAVITGADINDPVVDVIQNDFSGTIVWTRTNAGSYTGTLTGAFTEKKTHVQCTGYMDGYNLLASGGRTGIDTVNVRTTRQANPSAAYYFWNYDIPSTAFVNVTIEVFD